MRLPADLPRLRGLTVRREATALAVLAIAGVVATPAAADVAASQPGELQRPGPLPRVRPLRPRLRRPLRRRIRSASTPTSPTHGGCRSRGGASRAGDFSRTVPLRAGTAFTITVRNEGGGRASRYHVRCLPSDFPTYTFTRYGPVSPEYFAADTGFAPVKNRYAMIFDNHGVPIWWYRAPAVGPRVLPSGNVLWFRRTDSPSRYEIHRLDGSLVRTLEHGRRRRGQHPRPPAAANGDYLIGAHTKQHHVDTSAYGGSSDANVRNAELQEVSPSGQLVWDWKSEDHISLAETGRWWPWVIEHRTTATTSTTGTRSSRTAAR